MLKNDDLTKRMGQALKELRKGRHMTVEELADETSLSTSTIVAYECGKGNSINTFWAIANAMGYSLEFCFNKRFNWPN